MPSDACPALHGIRAGTKINYHTSRRAHLAQPAWQGEILRRGPCRGSGGLLAKGGLQLQPAAAWHAPPAPRLGKQSQSSAATSPSCPACCVPSAFAHLMQSATFNERLPADAEVCKREAATRSRGNSTGSMFTQLPIIHSKAQLPNHAQQVSGASPPIAKARQAGRL